MGDFIIEDGVKRRGYTRRRNCNRRLRIRWLRALTNITIPDSVTEIEGWAFSDCNSLKTIEYTGSEEQLEWVKKGKGWKPENTQVICTGTYYGNSKSI